MNRLAIADALLGLVNASGVFKTTGRRLVHWSKVPPSDQPACFVRSPDDDYPERAAEGLPATITLKKELWVYANNGGDQSIAPADLLEQLLDQVDTALKPGPCFQTQTLGGLVQRCWIEGTVEKDPGDLGGTQAVAVIPILILVPN